LGQFDDLVEDVEGADVDELEDVAWEAGLGEVGEEALADEGRLRRGTEDDCVSGQEGWDERIDRDEVRVLCLLDRVERGDLLETERTFHAVAINVGPTGSFFTLRLNPFSGCPGCSRMLSSAIDRR
jgi:hypothetical protein